MDIGSYEDVPIAIFANMQTANANGTSSNLLDTYALIEGLVGSAQNDTLTGADANGAAGNGVNNYLVGGAGNDTLTGLGDDDGLDPRRACPPPVTSTTSSATASSSTTTSTGSATTGMWPPATATSRAPSQNWMGTGETRVVVPGRHPRSRPGRQRRRWMAVDTAIYRGNLADYKIEWIQVNGFDVIRITDLRTATDANGNPSRPTASISCVGVEFAQFADQTISLVPTPPVLDLHAFNITTGNIADNFDSASWSNSTGSMGWASNWSEAGDTTTGNVVTGGQIQIDAGGGSGSNQLRLLDNGDGASIRRELRCQRCLGSDPKLQLLGEQLR